MSRVLAQDYNWELTPDNFVPIGNLDGALQALPAGDAEVFLWNMSMTQPHVDAGTFKRVGVFPTPWPSFAVAASASFVEKYPGLAESASEVARARAEALELDESLAQFVVQRYGLEFEGALEWVSQVNWASPNAQIDHSVVDEVANRMKAIGRIR